VFQVLGVVSERDLDDIRRTLARLEKRLTRIEARRRKAQAPVAHEEPEKHHARSAS
jgi:hypothetical protein